MVLEKYDRENLLSIDDLELLAEKVSASLSGGNILLLPPDFSRFPSGAGKIAQLIMKTAAGRRVKKIIPATGTHSPLTAEEKSLMYGDIPDSLFENHNWKGELKLAGTVPEDFVRDVSGLAGFSIPVRLNSNIFDPFFSSVISVGQVVPHEVAGMANHNKNIVVGTGGPEIINLSHYISALYGMEKIMGTVENPVRAVFDYAETNFLGNIDVFYILTVCGRDRKGNHGVKGIFAGRGRECYIKACEASLDENITRVGKKPLKIVVSLDRKIKSTWIGNKAVYRSRLAIADGGELVIVAPWVETFGEDIQLDAIIRKYGYRGKDYITEAVRGNSDIAENLSAAAHLVHGSSEGRFTITWCPGKLGEAEIRGVGYNYCGIGKLPDHLKPENLKEGFNLVGDKEIYYISDPGQGLWVSS